MNDLQEPSDGAPPVARRWRIGPWRVAGLLLVALLAGVSHARWRAGEDLGIHARPALAAGLVLLIAVDGLIAFVRGGSQAWPRTMAWLTRGATWQAGAGRLVLAGSVIVLFYSIERWQGHRAWTAVARDAAARGEDLSVPPWVSEPLPASENFAELPVFEPIRKMIERRSDYVEDVVEPDLGPLSRVAKWDLTRRLWGARSRMPTVAAWMSGETTDFLAWWRTWPTGANPSGELGTRPDARPGRLPKPGADVGEEGNAERVPALPDGTPVAEAAALVLERWSEFDPVLDAVREGSGRTACRFDLDYERQMWSENPVLPVFNGLVTLLRLRASALLARDRGAEALADLELALQLIEYAGEQPWAIRGTQSLWVVLETMQPVWEGVSRRGWTSEQLETLQRRLESMDLLARYRVGVRNDAFAMADLIESFLPANRGGAQVPIAQRRTEEIDRLYAWIRFVYPTGWSLQNQAALHRHCLDVTAIAVDASGPRVTSGPLDGSVLASRSSDPLFSTFVVPKARQMGEDAHTLFAAAQSAITFAAAACALERYRLMHGIHPETGPTVVPRFLARWPADLHTGKPVAYERMEHGYALRVAGADGVDDGGRPVARDEAKRPRLEDGDLVWRVAK